MSVTAPAPFEWGSPDPNEEELLTGPLFVSDILGSSEPSAEPAFATRLYDTYEPEDPQEISGGGLRRGRLIAGGALLGAVAAVGGIIETTGGPSTPTQHSAQQAPITQPETQSRSNVVKFPTDGTKAAPHTPRRHNVSRGTTGTDSAQNPSPSAVTKNPDTLVTKHDVVAKRLALGGTIWADAVWAEHGDQQAVPSEVKAIERDSRIATLAKTHGMSEAEMVRHLSVGTEIDIPVSKAQASQSKIPYSGGAGLEASAAPSRPKAVHAKTSPSTGGAGLSAPKTTAAAPSGGAGLTAPTPVTPSTAVTGGAGLSAPKEAKTTSKASSKETPVSPALYAASHAIDPNKLLRGHQKAALIRHAEAYALYEARSVSPTTQFMPEVRPTKHHKHYERELKKQLHEAVSAHDQIMHRVRLFTQDVFAVLKHHNVNAYDVEAVSGSLIQVMQMVRDPSLVATTPGDTQIGTEMQQQLASQFDSILFHPVDGVNYTITSQQRAIMSNALAAAIASNPALSHGESQSKVVHKYSRLARAVVSKTSEQTAYLANDGEYASVSSEVGAGMSEGGKLMLQKAAAHAGALIGVDPNELAAHYYVENGGWTDPLAHGLHWSVSYAGAQGPMQFEPGTWATYAEPGWNINDLQDSMIAAAKLLKAAGTNLDPSAQQVFNAAYVYNHSDSYASEVQSIWGQLREHPAANLGGRARIARAADHIVSHAVHKANDVHGIAKYIAPVKPGETDPGRVDQGDDIDEGNGPFDAFAESRVIGIDRDWFNGEPLIAMRILNGAYRGDYWYAAECLIPVVHPGEDVGPGTKHLKIAQLISNASSCSNGIEVGFGDPSSPYLALDHAVWAGNDRDGVYTNAGHAMAALLEHLGVKVSSVQGESDLGGPLPTHRVLGLPLAG